MEQAQHAAALLRQCRFAKAQQREHDADKQHARTPSACAQYAHRASQSHCGGGAQRLSLADTFIPAHPIPVAFNKYQVKASE
jgi:hypothetical protein